MAEDDHRAVVKFDYGFGGDGKMNGGRFLGERFAGSGFLGLRVLSMRDRTVSFWYKRAIFSAALLIWLTCYRAT